MLLRKGVYPYEDMDSWERFDETSMPHKEPFFCSLNIETMLIMDVDYRHAYRHDYRQMVIIDMQKECSKTLVIKI